MQRGEVFHLRAPRALGYEQHGQRYGVVLQAEELLALSTVIVAPTSTVALPASFRPQVTIRGRRTRVLVEQLGTVDPARLGRSAGVLGAPAMRAVDDAVARVLALT